MIDGIIVDRVETAILRNLKQAIECQGVYTLDRRYLRLAARAAIKAYAKALAERGMVIVPRRATPRMINAGCAEGIKHTSAGTDTYPYALWGAMIAAAHHSGSGKV